MGARGLEEVGKALAGPQEYASCTDIGICGIEGRCLVCPFRATLVLGRSSRAMPSATMAQGLRPGYPVSRPC